MSSTYLGLDVGGTNVRLAVWNGDAPVVSSRASLPPDYAGFIALVRQLAGPYEADAVGVGLPGVAFDQEVSWVPNAPFLANGRLAGDLSAALGAPVFCANDAHTALLGEARFGAAVGVSTALLISVGTGVGGGLLISGRVYRGARGSAGSLGWVHLGLDEWHEEHGQLELVASGTALSEAAARSGRTAEQLVEAARNGEPEALEAVGLMARRLGFAVSTLVSVFDPQVVLMSGGLSAEFNLFAPELTSTVRRFASPSTRDIPIKAAALGVSAGAMGAAALAREREGAFI